LASLTVSQFRETSIVMPSPNSNDTGRTGGLSVSYLPRVLLGLQGQLEERGPEMKRVVGEHAHPQLALIERQSINSRSASSA
jgi:hypothetical protein